MELFDMLVLAFSQIGVIERLIILAVFILLIVLDALARVNRNPYWPK